MTDSWANLAERIGMDLHLDLHLNITGTGGRRRALTEALRTAITDGRLSAGDKLPPYRSLAADLHLSRGTVGAVYQELIAEGWLVARQGSGTIVADVGRTATLSRPAHAPHPLPRHDFQLGQPNPGLFPRTEWTTATRRVMTTAPNTAFAAGHAQGHETLRIALARYLSRTRGVRTDADHIVVCTAVSQALELLARALNLRQIAVESYGLQFHTSMMERGGAATVPVPIDDHGLRVDLLPDVRAVVATPTHQFPMGMALSPDRRTALIDWARGTESIVLEDDYDGELRYDREPIGALQALAPESVLYLGTASKSLSPAVRIAWMVVPDHLLDAVIEAKGVREGTASIVDQLIFADLIDSGAYDRHVRRSRQFYRLRRDRLLELLDDTTQIGGIAAGLHTVIQLPTGREQAAVAEASERGFRLLGLSTYRHPGASSPAAEGLVVGFGTPTAAAFDRDVIALRELVRRHR